VTLTAYTRTQYTDCSTALHPALNSLPLLPSYRRRAFPSKFSHQSVLAVLAERAVQPSWLPRSEVLERTTSEASASHCQTACSPCNVKRYFYSFAPLRFVHVKRRLQHTAALLLLHSALAKMKYNSIRCAVYIRQLCMSQDLRYYVKRILKKLYICTA